MGTRVEWTTGSNGLRPGRFLVTDDGLVVLASEIGVLDFSVITAAAHVVIVTRAAKVDRAQ